MKILVLGGTADGRRLAEQLCERQYEVLYSIAGLVRRPTLACEIVVGGFTQFNGLANFLETRQIDLVINATHPYAVNMSNKAVCASCDTGIPLWRFLRPAWQPQTGDKWFEYANDEALVAQLKGYKRPLLSAGQLSYQTLLAITQVEGVTHSVWRTAASPSFTVPDHVTWQKAIGPFDLTNERDLLQTHAIDVIVSKNSGGESTSAKLDAARELGIDVLLQQRPEELAALQSYSDLAPLIAAIERLSYASVSHPQDTTSQ